MNNRRRATHPTLVLVLVLVGVVGVVGVVGTLGTLPDVQTPQPSLDGEGVVQQLRLERGLRLERRSGRGAGPMGAAAAAAYDPTGPLASCAVPGDRLPSQWSMLGRLRRL